VGKTNLLNKQLLEETTRNGFDGEFRGEKSCQWNGMEEEKSCQWNGMEEEKRRRGES